MAKKDEKQLKFLQLPIPSGTQKYSTVTKANFSGLNKRQVMDTGELSAECNISTKEAPYLTPSPAEVALIAADGNKLSYQKPLALFGFDDFLIMIYMMPVYSEEALQYHNLMVDMWRIDENGLRITSGKCEKYTGVIKSGLKDETYDEVCNVQRSMVQFSVYNSERTVLRGKYTRRLLLFPDKVAFNLDIKALDKSPNDGDYDTAFVYFYNNEYYAWKEDSFAVITSSIKVNNESCFECDNLDVELKSYFNDGYIKTEDEVYKDGYFKTTDKKYNSDKKYYIFANEGSVLEVKGLNYIVEVEGEAEVIGGNGSDVTGLYIYNSADGTYSKTTHTQAVEGYRYYKYFTEDTHEPMLNIIRNADESTSVIGYYEYSEDGNRKKYYERSGTLPYYSYTEIEGLENGDSVDGKYEYSDNFSPEYSDGVPTESDVPDELQGYYCYNTANDFVYVYEDGIWKRTANPHCPDLKYAAVHLSRLIGVGNDRVYVSGYNDYTNWQLDSADEESSNNAWCSASQSNSKADGEFTGIVVYDNRVVCFKRDYMHEISGSKNPFRLNDIYADGAIDNRSICEVNGKLIFASGNQVKVYTGAIPRIISYNLGFESITKAVAGSDGRNYYLYCICDGEPHFFVYDTYADAWSERGAVGDIVSMCYAKGGMYLLTSDKKSDGDTLGAGMIYRINGDEFDSQEWSFETDLTAGKSINIKHIKKVQILADVKSGSVIKVYALYDDETFNENTSHLLYDSGGKYGRIPIRVKPRMTAGYGFKLHICGSGYVKLYNMSIEITGGGEKLVSL